MARLVFSVDLNKPLVLQVGNLGDAYEEWLHQTILSKESPPFFANGVIEFFTRTPWWAIPLIWLPISGWFVSSSLKHGIAPSHVTPAVVAGVFLWTLLEYLLHRFLFHIRTTSYWKICTFFYSLLVNLTTYLGTPDHFSMLTSFFYPPDIVDRVRSRGGNTVHYMLHGNHHKHPMDSLRLVFPPLGTAIISVLVWNLTKLLVPTPYSYSLFGGTLMGYIMYDCTHYYLHHGKPSKGVSYQLKGYHMNHHFRNLDKGFGVTTTFWDRIFRTLPPESSPRKDY